MNATRSDKARRVRRAVAATLIATAALGAGHTTAQAAERPIHLTSAQCPAIVAQGSRGGCVTELQNQLNAHGARLNVDGIFGTKTLAAVREYQKAHPPLLVDGLVGPQTKASLYAPRPSAPRAAKPAPKPAKAPVIKMSRPSTKEAAFRRSVLAEADKVVKAKVPYSWGGGHGAKPGLSYGVCDGEACGATTTKGLDCSGYVRLVFWKASGVDLNGSTQTMLRSSHLRAISAKEAVAGDIILFGTPDSAHHVAIYAGTRRGQRMMYEEKETGTLAGLHPVRPAEAMYFRFVR